MQIDIPLTEPQLRFVSSKSKNPAIIGGLGCVRGDTKIHTEHGLMRICDITSATRVLSWNESNQQFQFSLSGGAFPKGRANLYRIATQRGEFVASGHHQILSSNGTYSQVEDLETGDKVLVSTSPLLTTQELAPKLSLEDDPHYNQIDASLLECYADEARQYGQQLLTAQETDLFYPPSSNGAHTLSRTCDLYAFSHEDALEEQKRARSRHDLFGDLIHKQDYAFHNEALEGVEVNQISSLPIAHTLSYHLEYWLSRVMCACRRIVQRPFSVFRSFAQPYSSYSSLSETMTIISVEQLETQEPYFDMQVLNTNNYVCENGFIHHNSGKSRAGTMRILALMLANPKSNGAYYMPTYDLLNLRALPGIIEDLEMMGIPYIFHSQKMTVKIQGYGDLILRSYDNPKRIVAYEVAFSIVDELDTLPIEKAEEVWRKITERNRQTVKGVINSIGCVTTPDQGFNGIVYKKWVADVKEGYELIKAPTHSNPYLPDDYIEQIRANYDPLLAEMYIEGEFVNLSADKVYKFFDREKHHTDNVITADDRALHISIDFNVGGCCATVSTMYNNVLETKYEFSCNDTSDFINYLNAKFPRTRITVYPDASGKSESTNASASDIAMIRQAGFNVDVTNKNPFIRDRVNAVNAMFTNTEWRINTKTCPNLTKALEQQGYDKHGKPEKFNEHPAIDDWTDSFGYKVYRLFPVVKPTTRHVRLI